tara:strand:+ start:112 stop:447 length:336 start_codon:yes stop_codon:yes gene_type:complete
MSTIKNVLCLLLLTILTTNSLPISSEEEKCCDICPSGTDKYYSTPFFFKHNCGESCIKPEDYLKYKILEPALTKANSSHPCQEKGFINFLETETHSFGSIKIDLDMYSNKN